MKMSPEPDSYIKFTEILWLKYKFEAVNEYFFVPSFSKCILLQCIII